MPASSKSRKSVAVVLVIALLVVVAVAVVLAVRFGGLFEIGGSSEVLIVSVAPSIAPTVTATTLAPTPRACNGLESLCNVPVNATLFATAHNAHFDSSVAFLAPNHNQDLSEALSAGVRGLAIDFGLCMIDGERVLRLVHGTCVLGFSDPAEVLGGINDFLHDNPHEVILIPAQIDDGTGGIVVLADIYDVMVGVVDASNISLADRLYQHPNQTAPWPTLGELIDADKRVLYFQYNGHQGCNRLGATCPPGFHDWFRYAMETKFSFDSVDQVRNDVAAACAITRGSSGTQAFFGVNLFLRIANVDASAEMNEASFLRQHLEACSAANGGIAPNLVTVDFWSVGDVVQVAQEFNGRL